MLYPKAQTYVMYKIKNIHQKLKDWYRGEYIPYTVQEMFDLHKIKYLVRQKQNMPYIFNRPLIVRIINSARRFWLRRWSVLLPIIIALIGIAVMLFIHFDSNTSG